MGSNLVQFGAPGPQRDPVCGMLVDPSAAPARREYQGRVYYFCCPRCAERFSDEPDGFVADQRPAPRAQGLHTCPMHPEVRQEGHGDCPKCGMALEPAAPAAADEATRNSTTCGAASG